jgi:hypothetical protein
MSIVFETDKFNYPPSKLGEYKQCQLNQLLKYFGWELSNNIVDTLLKIDCKQVSTLFEYVIETEQNDSFFGVFVQHDKLSFSITNPIEFSLHGIQINTNKPIDLNPSNNTLIPIQLILTKQNVVVMQLLINRLFEDYFETFQTDNPDKYIHKQFNWNSNLIKSDRKIQPLHYEKIRKKRKRSKKTQTLTQTLEKKTPEFEYDFKCFINPSVHQIYTFENDIAPVLYKTSSFLEVIISLHNFNLKQFPSPKFIIQTGKLRSNRLQSFINKRKY